MYFRKIDIRRMPGFETNGFTLDSLSPGINLVYGPNASGKSTTARAIQLILWPGTMKSTAPSVIGLLDIDGSDWMVELDVNTFQYQCNGNKSESPHGLPGPDVRQQYYLSLHELLEDNNLTFAEKIIREAAGGYDAQVAGKSLKFSESIYKPQSLINDLKTIRKEQAVSKQLQRSLRDEENQLEKLEEEREQARSALERCEWLKKAIHYQECRLKKQNAQDLFQNYPKEMDNLIGNELERLEKIKQERNSKQQQIQQLERNIAAAQQQLEQCCLPKEGVSETLIPKLRLLANRLNNIQLETDRLDREIINAQRLEGDAKARVSPSIDIECLERLDRTALDEFAELSRKDEICRANYLAENELKKWVGDIEKQATLNQIQLGADVLIRWLNAAEGNGLLHYRWFLFGMMLSGILLGLGGAFIWLNVSVFDSPYMEIFEGSLIFAGAALLVWIINAHPNRTRRRDFQKQYSELEIYPLGKWTIDNVIQQSRILQKKMAELEVCQEKAIKWEDLQGKIENHHREQEKLREQRERLLQQYGLAPMFSMGTIPEPHLTQLVSNIISWQQAFDQKNSLKSEKEKATEQFSNCLDEINKNLLPYSDQIVKTVENAVPSIDELNSRREAFNDATASLRTATQQLEDRKYELGVLETEYSVLFDNVGIPQDEVLLNEYCRNLDVFKRSKEQLKLAEFEEKQSCESLSKYPELREQDEEDLNRELIQKREMADCLEELNNRIGGIRRAIEDAKNKDDLEQKLSKEETVLDQLRNERDKNYSKLIGSLLVNEIDKANRSTNMPEVFHQAERIFSQITRGRYRLLIDSQSPPSFRAFDTSLERGQSLEEISSGTRLQIMMAVRLAFVERQETGLKIPLLMDECLGNSDDTRAQTIIDSVIELCREGRQVFYFTAQHDEVGKWLNTLQKTDIPHKVIDLAEVRNFLDSEKLPQLDLPSPQHYHPPDPNGCSYEEYGRLLKAPEFDPWQPIGSMHLWHLIDSPSVLYSLISKGLNRWGQLQTLGEEYGNQIVGEDPCILKRAIAMSKVFEVIGSCLKIGKGKPVDRSSIIDSKAVSDTFIGPVCDLVKKFNGDASKLIVELEKQSVSGFRKAKCRELEEYFIEKGFIDERSVMRKEDVRARILTFVMTLPDHDLLNQDHLEKIIDRICTHYL